MKKLILFLTALMLFGCDSTIDGRIAKLERESEYYKSEISNHNYRLNNISAESRKLETLLNDTRLKLNNFPKNKTWVPVYLMCSMGECYSTSRKEFYPTKKECEEKSKLECLSGEL